MVNNLGKTLAGLDQLLVYRIHMALAAGWDSFSCFHFLLAACIQTFPGDQIINCSVIGGCGLKSQFISQTLGKNFTDTVLSVVNKNL